MPADFFPKREAEIVQWSSNFSAQINAPSFAAQLGLTSQQVSEYATLQETFESLYQLSQSNTTRTPSIIQAKHSARIALEKPTRLLVRIIRGHKPTAEQRITLRIPLRNPGGPRGVGWSRSGPQGHENAPRLGVVSVNGLRVRLQLRDRSSPMNRGKPKDVAGASVFSCVGELPPAVDDLAKWRFERQAMRAQFDVKFAGRGRAVPPPGTKVWFMAFWFNRRGQRSVACEPAYTHLGYGLALAA